MAKLRNSRFYQLIVLLLACTASALIGLALRNGGVIIAKTDRPAIVQQSDEKIIERREFPNEPFVFGDLSVKKVKISPRQKLSAISLAERGGGQVEDWLENLEFTIKNKWDKTATYIDLDLDFPETGIGRPLMVYDLDLGVHPTAFGDAKKYGKPLALPPGDTITFSLSPKKMGMIKNFLAQGGFQLVNLNKATIRIAYMIFDDGTMWSQGKWCRLVPDRPGQCEPITN